MKTKSYQGETVSGVQLIPQGPADQDHLYEACETNELDMDLLTGDQDRQRVRDAMPATVEKVVVQRYFGGSVPRDIDLFVLVGADKPEPAPAPKKSGSKAKMDKAPKTAAPNPTGLNYTAMSLAESKKSAKALGLIWDEADSVESMAPKLVDAKSAEYRSLNIKKAFTEAGKLGIEVPEDATVDVVQELLVNKLEELNPA